MPDLQQSIASSEQVPDLPTEDKMSLAVTALRNLSDADRADVQQRVGLGAPGKGTTDQIWLIVIGTFCVVLLGATFTLAFAVIRKIDAPALLTIFTTTTAFLAGLLSPSPTAVMDRQHETKT
jgi:hypothetical protein